MRSTEAALKPMYLELIREILKELEININVANSQEALFNISELRNLIKEMEINL